MLMIGPEERAALKQAMERARDMPMPIESVRRAAHSIDQVTNTITLDERKKAPLLRNTQNVALPIGYRVAISFEQQPLGLCLHLSMSTSASGKLPSPAAVNMVLEALGIAHDVEAEDFPGRTWIEEYEVGGGWPGGLAINAVVLIEPAQEGHA